MQLDLLEYLLNEEKINEIARKVGLCKRIRKFKPINLLKMVVFHPNNIAKDILNSITLNLFEISNLLVRSEALNKRFNERFVDFLKAIFLELISNTLNINKPSKDVKDTFNKILLTDSSVSKLHHSLAEVYPGGNNGDGKFSGLKINFIKDLKSGTPVDIELSEGTKNDFKFLPRLKKVIKARDLILNDLGYYSLDFFKFIAKKKAFFISKLKLNSTKTLFVKNPNPERFKNGNMKSSSRFIPVDLETLCNELEEGENREIEEVYVGLSTKRLPCRLIITRLDGVLQEKRLKTITSKIRGARPYLREEKKDIAKYGFMITNIPKEKYSKDQIYPIYSLRWQIELDFKNWKSILEIDESSRKLKKERVEVHFYGRLINILINSELSKMFKDDAYEKSIVLSETKVFKKISYYLYKLHHYNYKTTPIMRKLKILIPRTCLKSKKKGMYLSDEILKLVT